MMKKLLISSVIVAAMFIAGNAQAKYIDPVTESKLVKVCEAIKSDRLIKVHVAVKNSDISLKQITNGLLCNGAHPVNFALANNAVKTAEFLARKSRGNHQQLLTNL
jgi:hypothetical protein